MLLLCIPTFALTYPNHHYTLQASSSTFAPPNTLVTPNANYLHQHKPPNEFELNRGRVVDTLRNDLPHIFSKPPELGIFTPDLELCDVRDANGSTRLRGRNSYARLFDAARFLRKTTLQDAEVKYRLVLHDETVRVRWEMRLLMRHNPLLRDVQPAVVHLDGISVYELNHQGLVFRHRIEDIALNGGEVNLGVDLSYALGLPGASAMVPELAIPYVGHASSRSRLGSD